MKKLIIAAAIVCAAAASQAAAVGWSVGAGNTWGSCDYALFVIGKGGDAEHIVTGIDQIKSLVEADGLSAASDYAFATGYSLGSSGSASVTAANSGKSITYVGPGTENYTGFIFIENAAGDEATYTATANIAMANNDQGKTFSFGNQSTNVAANKFEVAPEPTSGLLLLLGVAGLALRRRRA